MSGFNLPPDFRHADFERAWASDDEPLPEAPDPDDIMLLWAEHSSGGIFLND